MKRLLLALAIVLAAASPPPTPTQNGGTGASTPPTAGQLPTGNTSGGQSTWQTMTGDCTVTAALVITCVPASAAPTSVTAAGTNQGTATALSVGYSVITVSPYQAGVIAPATLNKVSNVANQSLNESLLYPPSGAHWGVYATNAALGINPGAGAQFYCTSSTQCYAN